ncbi:hypothetical protein A5647_00055 [Mycobacterium sp. 1100029.7]|nr:hypothetical protein A5647_00055 [Mycobacterium sp. 1100029.7]
MPDKEAEHDHATSPGTAPFVPDFDDDPGTQGFVPNFDDDPGTQGFVPDFDDTGAQPIPIVAEPPRKAKNKFRSKAKAEPETPAVAAASDGDSQAEPVGAAVQSVTVPGRYQYLKWWKLALVILGVWAATAEVGLSLFYWWYHTIDKTPAVFMALVYVVVCVVGGVMLAMVQGRPLIAALSIAVMSGPFASVLAAAPLYGYYYCARTGHCLLGVIPY